jgi:beta-phosphoglucomutase-like phosphatase (HAD superfamily)
MMQSLKNTAYKKDAFAFFDMDGTLVQTDMANFLAYKKAVEIVMQGQPQIFLTEDCRFGRNELRRQLPNITYFEYKRIVQMKATLDAELVKATCLNLFVLTQLITLSQHASIYLVTNACRARAELTLKHHNLTRHFDGLLCKEDRPSKASKYHHAIDYLGANTSNIILFENENTEISHARAAGIKLQSIQKV